MTEQLTMFSVDKPVPFAVDTAAIAASGDRRNTGYDPNKSHVSEATIDQGWQPADTLLPRRQPDGLMQARRILAELRARKPS